ncbi:hypothetical protein PybrP1_008105 [[Pythium] brassicae (nom. inval.)]|nr:hypothetical protein PybrP1_008105 [[Pythium] brassicae (nom. inval.)]
MTDGSGVSSTVSGSSATDDASTASQTTAGTVTTGSSSGFLSTLTAKAAPGSFHMTPVRSVQARVQSDAPAWNAEGKRFVSKYYTSLQDAYVGLMDTVNTASVEGALMYVQAEGINYNTRSAETRCQRKSSMAYIVFYDLTITQTNETLALTFTEFCENGGVEFTASEDGVWKESIDFWLKPQDEDANAARAKLLVAAYQNLTSGGKSGQLSDDIVAHMLPLPTITELVAENPPCYKNVAKCNTRFGCKRDKYAQLCTVCTSTADGCVAPPSDFTFPTLAKAVGTGGGTGSASKNASKNSSSGGSSAGVVTSAAAPRTAFSAALFATIAVALVSVALG